MSTKIQKISLISKNNWRKVLVFELFLVISQSERKKHPLNKGKTLNIIIWNYKAQSFVIETHEQYPKKLCFDVFGADRLAQFNIQSGEELLVSFDIDAHEYQGRWFNSVRAWNFQRVDPNAVAGAMGGMQPGAFPPVGAPVAPAQPAAPANGATAAFPPVQPAAPAAEGGSADDLPF